MGDRTGFRPHSGRLSRAENAISDDQRSLLIPHDHLGMRVRSFSAAAIRSACTYPSTSRSPAIRWSRCSLTRRTSAPKSSPTPVAGGVELVRGFGREVQRARRVTGVGPRGGAVDVAAIDVALTLVSDFETETHPSKSPCLRVPVGAKSPGRRHRRLHVVAHESE